MRTKCMQIMSELGRAPNSADAVLRVRSAAFAWVVTLIAPMALWAQAPSSTRGSRPNVVLVVADDLGVYDLACYGRLEHRTPHLDRLASEGIRFSSGYCGLPICSASRASLLTSKYPARLHLTSYLPGRPDAASQKLLNAVMEPALVPSAQTIAEVLKRDGYATGVFGKWHLGADASSPAHQGFDVVFEPPGNGDPESTGGKNERWIVDEAKEFIQSHRDQPFFCYIAHHSPHIMLKERASEIALHKDAWNPLYAASIASLDRSVGMLLDVLEEASLKDNTIVIFTSDNGGLHVPEGHKEPVTHNGPYRAGKGYLYEGGLRVPLILRWPGHIAAGRVTDTPVSLMDVMPTLLEATGIEVSKSVGPVDGQSLVRLLTTEEAKPAESERMFFWHLPHYTNQGSRPASAVRRGRWKLHVDLETGKAQLFDLESDVGERIDVASQNPAVVQELTEGLIAWKRAVGAQECKANPSWSAEAHHALYVDRDPSELRGGESTSVRIGEDWAEWRRAMNSAVAGGVPSLKPTEGSIRLHASQAQVHGVRLRFEPETYKDVLGYWTEVGDWADWRFQVPRAGAYAIEVHCGSGAGQGGSEVDLVVTTPNAEGRILPWKVRETGHFQNIIIEPVGVIDFLAEGEATLEVRPRTKAAAAIMDIREVVLRPLGK